MAYRAPNADTTVSSTTGWDTSTNTPVLHASTNTSVNGTARFTTTFTAPNTTNAATGLMLHVVTTGTLTWRVTLQEDLTGSATWVDTVATATIPSTDLQNNCWANFRFASPYTFATTGANRYRYKIDGTGVSGSGAAASETSTSNYCFISYDSRVGAIGASDQIMIIAPNNTGSRTVTVDGTNTVGNYGDTTILAAQRSLNNAIWVGKNAVFTWDTAASATLTCKGNMLVNADGGEWRMGTVASPYPSDKLAWLRFDMAADGDHGVRILSGGKAILQGTPKSSTTLWKTTYSSGAGTAADPFITATAVDWSVGDEILIAATSDNAANYNETENRFIITKNSATSYVLSLTKGGAEAALTYTHTTSAYVLNVERNVLIDSTNTSRAMYLYQANTTAGNFNADWVRFETMGHSTVTTRVGIQITPATNVVGSADYCVAYRPRYRGFYFATSKEAQTYTGLIVCNGAQVTNSIGALSCNSIANMTFNDCFSIKNNRCGIQATGVPGCVFNRCVSISNNTIGTSVSSAVGSAGLYLTTGQAVFNDLELHANRLLGLSINGNIGAVFNRLLSGTKGTNTTDINTNLDTQNILTFDSSVFGSASFIENYLTQLTGAEVRFHRLAATDNNHAWYTEKGIARSTGAGLVDTTVRTAGSLGLRIAPEEAVDGFTWEFNIPAKANSIINFFGWFKLNAAFTGDAGASATVELWLPTSSSADATATLSKATNDWQAAVLSATNTLDTDGLALIKINGITATSAAYLYADDFYNAGDTVTSTDKVTGLDTWYQGKPVSIISPQATSAADIWTFPFADLDTTGTIGNLMTKILTVGKFLGLK